MTTIIETNYGDFQIKMFELENNEVGYDVYTKPHENELFGQYIGEFFPTISWDDDLEDDEKEIFIYDLEEFVREKY